MSWFRTSADLQACCNRWRLGFSIAARRIRLRGACGDEQVGVDMGGHGGATKQMKLAEYVDSFPQYEREAADGAPVPYLR